MDVLDPDRAENAVTVSHQKIRVDLRSDTVTKPSSGMRAAMAAAEVGDDVYGTTLR